MTVEIIHSDSNQIIYEFNDKYDDGDGNYIDGKYKLMDTLDKKGRIKSTTVIHSNLDEVEDSDLFKKIVQARSWFNYNNQITNNS
jgi:hypothetical protein